MLVVLSLAFMGGALRLRNGRRRHSVQLVNAAGLAALVLGLLYVVNAAVASFANSLIDKLQNTPGLAVLSSFVPGNGVGFGWQLYLIAIGFGLVAYAAVDHEPGPGYIGAAVLVVFALVVGLRGAGGGSIVGWPLFLLVIGAAGLAIGLRPREPLPPPPGRREPAPTIPIEPGGGAARTVPFPPVDSDE
jgi:hypothetical protein